MKLFRDYKAVAADYITSQERPFYPDYLVDAVALYDDVIRLFQELALAATDSSDLLLRIQAEDPTARIQLLRAFRKYVSPMTSVEMLKVKSRQKEVLANFGSTFRRKLPL